MNVMFDAIEPVKDLNLQSASVSTEMYMVETYQGESFVSQFQFDSVGKPCNPTVIEPALLADRLAHESNLTLIDSRVLAKSASTLIWHYSPRPTQNISYSYNGVTFCRPIQLPNMVFIKQGNGLRVAVVQHKSRPTMKTKLYHCPLPNISRDGTVCLGSLNIKGMNDIDEISEAYLDSVKTHLNYNGAKRNVTLDNKAYLEWLTEHFDKAFSMSDLAIMGTLQDFISQKANVNL